MSREPGVREDAPYAEIVLTRQEIRFLLSAVWNYDGMGVPRLSVLAKLKGLLPEEDIERTFQVHAPRPSQSRRPPL
jgi:hypothetical protein